MPLLSVLFNLNIYRLKVYGGSGLNIYNLRHNCPSRNQHRFHLHKEWEGRGKRYYFLLLGP